MAVSYQQLQMQLEATKGALHQEQQKAKKLEQEKLKLEEKYKTFYEETAPLVAEIEKTPKFWRFLAWAKLAVKIVEVVKSFNLK